jgi:PAS domain S-box-containing protein
MLLVMVEQTDAERDTSTERFRTLFKYSNDLICFFGLDGRIIDANPAAVEKYGYPKEELLQLSVFQLRSPEEKERIEVQITEAQQKGIAFETVHYRKDGTPIPVEVHSVGATIRLPSSVSPPPAREITNWTLLYHRSLFGDFR